MVSYAETLANNRTDQKRAGGDLRNRKERCPAMFDAEVNENDGSDEVLHNRRAALSHGASRLHAQDFCLRYFCFTTIVFPCVSHERCCSRRMDSNASSHGISRTLIVTLPSSVSGNSIFVPLSLLNVRSTSLMS